MPQVNPLRVIATSCRPDFDEVDDLVAPALGLDEVGIGLVVGEQAVAEGREAEEVILLLDLAERSVGWFGQRPSTSSFSVLNASQPLQ